jgi:CRISPR-associated endonuclease/helicase Cas3
LNVIFTSESSGKANASARRILDRYATRIGHNAWEASLTQEGLNTVKALLNRVSSSRTSVVCHRITNDGARVVAWIIGNKRGFTASGACATGWTARKLRKEDTELPYPVRLLSRVLSLAGLLHDIGKSTKAFQAVIRRDVREGFRNEGVREAFRHEAVSAMMLGWLANSGDDAKWVASFIAAIDSGELDSRIVDSLRAQAAHHSPANDCDSTAARRLFSGTSQRDCSETPVLFGLLWLIVAHHRLPEGAPVLNHECASINASGHARLNPKAEPIDTLVEDGLPWQQDAWKKRLRDDLQSLAGLLADPHFAQAKPWLFDHLRLFGRPALQLADHLISSDKKPARSPSPTYAYANSAELPDGSPTLGQKLHGHLIAVSRNAVMAVHELLSLRHEMPGVVAGEVPLLLRKRSKDGKYTWQDEAATAIRSHRTGVHEGAFFGVMIAGTGSGKTIGAIKLAAAFKNPLRVVYASPLRSLTLQSGNEFEGMGFGSDDMATIIGDPLIQKMHDADGKPLDPKDSFCNPECDEDYALDLAGGSCSPDVLERFRMLRCFRDRETRMITTPVLAATLDTVMKLADGRRGSYLSHLLRMASSDLIIDEVDMYSPVDLLAIGRLIEAAGFWRSRVTLSSATLSPVIAMGFFRAYFTGIKSRDAMTNDETRIFGGWFSDTTKPNIEKIASPESFDEAHLAFARSVADIAGQQGKRRVAGYLYPPEKPQNSNEMPQRQNESSLLKAINYLHQINSVSLPDGRRFSFGCIQVVNVLHCQGIAMSLANSAAQEKEGNELDIRVICLHGRLSLATRNWIDGQLNRMLCRKGQNGDLAPLVNPFVRDFVTASVHQNVAVILVSTLETTGRDHDFDWGVIESRQERDILQFAGRIRRHRPPLIGHDLKNLVIWDVPLRWDGKPWQPQKAGENPAAFQRFGVGDKIGNNTYGTNVDASNITQVSLRRAPGDKNDNYGSMPNYRSMMLATYGKNAFITPSRCLKDDFPSESEYDKSTRVAYTVRACETQRLRNALLESRKDKCHTLVEWLADGNRAGRLLSNHQNLYRFRAGRPMHLYWRDGDKQWYYVAEPARELDQSKPQKGIGNLEVNEKGFLFSFDEDAEIDEIRVKTGAFHKRDRIRLSSVYFTEQPSGDNFRLKYHPQIGLRNVDL